MLVVGSLEVLVEVLEVEVLEVEVLVDEVGLKLP